MGLVTGLAAEARNDSACMVTDRGYLGIVHYVNASNVFRPHNAGGTQKRNNHRHLDLCLKKTTRVGKSRDHRDVIV